MCGARRLTYRYAWPEIAAGAKLCQRPAPVAGRLRTGSCSENRTERVGLGGGIRDRGWRSDPSDSRMASFMVRCQHSHRLLAAIEPAADGPGVCCRRRAPTQFAPALIKLALPTVLVLLMTPAAEHEARPAFCMVRPSPACEQNAVAGAFAFLTT